MTNEIAASGPPWPIKTIPWPKLGTPAHAGLESVWAVGPHDGPVTALGSAADPREKWQRLTKISAVPLVIHDLRWAQGKCGRRLARALHRSIVGPIAVADYRLLVGVETVRLGIHLAEHAEVVAAIDAGAQADADPITDVPIIAVKALLHRMSDEERRTPGMPSRAIQAFRDRQGSARPNRRAA